MTVSRPDRNWHKLAAALLYGLITLPVYAQAEAATPVPQAASQLPEQSTPPADRQRTYFLGDQLDAPPLQSPALGAPQNILPEPYVPPGSQAVTPLPQAQTGTPVDGQLAAATNSEADRVSDPAALPGTTTEPLLADGAGSDSPTAALVAGADASAVPSQRERESQAFEEAALASFDPSLQAASPATDGSPPQRTAFLWDKLSRAQAIRLLEDLGRPAGSRSLRALARDIALGNFALPASEDEDEISALLAARLKLLRRIASPVGYLALIERLPRDRDWLALARQRADAFLVTGRIADACRTAETARSADSDPYWLRLAVLCAASTGQRDAVDFQYDILETVSEVSRNFYLMIDQIALVAAAEIAGTAAPEPAPLEAPLAVDPLMIAAARLARVPVTALDTDTLDPLALEAALGLPALTVEAQSALTRTALERGLLSSETLGAYFAGLASTGDREDTAVTSVFTDTGIDLAALAQLVEALAPGGGDRTLESRLSPLETLWQSSIAAGIGLPLAPLMAAAVADIAPQPLSRSQAAIMARLSLLTGEPARAAAWFTALRSSVAGQDLSRDVATTDLAPLMAATGAFTADLLPANPDAWWDRSRFIGLDPSREITRRAGLVYSLVEARGIPVPEARWQVLEERGSVLAGVEPQPALWRRFVRASQQDQQAALLASLNRMIAAYGLAAVPAVVAGSLDSGMRAAGLSSVADRLAVEILIAAGL